MKLKISIFAMLFTLLGATSLVAQNQNDGIPVTWTERYSNERDTLRAAMSFDFWDYYEGRVYYVPFGTQEYKQLQFTADKSGNITSVHADGEELLELGEGTLPGIPIPKGGMTNVYCYVSGIRDGRTIAHGDASHDRVDESNPLRVLMRPLNKTKFIQYDPSGLPEGVNLNDLRLVSSNGDWTGYYMLDLQGFGLWIDESVSSIIVWVVGPDGTRYDSFRIDPFADPETLQMSSVNFEYLAGVREFLFDETQNNPSAVVYGPLDQWTEVDEIMPDGEKRQLVKSRSFIFENVNQREIQFHVSGLSEDRESWMRVTAFEQVGDELLPIHEIVVAGDYEYDGTYELRGAVEIPRGGARKCIFLVEMLAGEPDGDFFFYLNTGGKG